LMCCERVRCTGFVGAYRNGSENGEIEHKNKVQKVQAETCMVVLQCDVHFGDDCITVALTE
jgi:hypothetical protein